MQFNIKKYEVMHLGALNTKASYSLCGMELGESELEKHPRVHPFDDKDDGRYGGPNI